MLCFGAENFLTGCFGASPFDGQANVLDFGGWGLEMFLGSKSLCVDFGATNFFGGNSVWEMSGI
jgi:hypothetical protein